ncbi:unnamed protein product [marine sediment metagenome]|uniref:Uncharacterized protein n=1 Tax=marine sediment metagenome TaxID=412755 RepID=X0ZRI7_9ZZZZ
MTVYHGTIDLQSKGLNPTYHDVTKKVKEFVHHTFWKLYQLL